MNSVVHQTLSVTARRREAAAWSRRALCLLFLLLGLLPARAWALCTITCSCSVQTTALSFAGVNPLSASVSDSTGTVKVSCGGIVGLLIPYRIELSTGGSGSYATRRLSGPGSTLNYNLYADSGHTQIWGNGTGGSSHVDGGMLLDVLGLSPAQTHWVYGRIPGSQTAALPGSYSDSMTVTLTYY